MKTEKPKDKAEEIKGDFLKLKTVRFNRKAFQKFARYHGRTQQSFQRFAIEKVMELPD